MRAISSPLRTALLSPPELLLLCICALYRYYLSTFQPANPLSQNLTAGTVFALACSCTAACFQLAGNCPFPRWHFTALGQHRPTSFSKASHCCLLHGKEQAPQQVAPFFLVLTSQETHVLPLYRLLSRTLSSSPYSSQISSVHFTPASFNSHIPQGTLVCQFWS